MTDQAGVRELARSIIAEVAPKEAPAFDYLWEKFERDPTALDPEDAGRPAHGIGAGDLTLASLIVIPVVSALVGEGVKHGIQHIISKVKERRARVRRTSDAADDERIATVIESKLDEAPKS